MKKQTFRALALPGILLALTATLCAQATGGGVTVNPTTYPPGVKPAVVKPAKPAVITPAKPAIITPAKPAIVHPATPLPPGTPVVPPGTIITTPPSTIYPPGTIVAPPGTVIVPSYPSAWIGPTIIRETRGEPSPSTTTQPLEPQIQMPVLRLVAVLGDLKRRDLGSGADIGIGETPLSVSVGMLIGYGKDQPFKASGDIFGHCWDGAGCFTKSDDWKQGPFLAHPVMEVNEISPGPWEFEAATPGRSITWMRLAVSLFEDLSQAANAKPVNLPRGRRAAMREVLHRVSWADKGVSTKPVTVSAADALAGADVTHFGKALATFAERTMAPTPDNERIGVAEWFFTADELGKIIAACPRFNSEIPTGTKLREMRAAAGSTMPVWVRAFDRKNDRTRCTGELWFIVVPDVAVNEWLGGGRS